MPQAGLFNACKKNNKDFVLVFKCILAYLISRTTCEHKMNKTNKQDHPSRNYKKGDIVVFKDITWESEGNEGFYSDHLHEVTRASKANNYLEIKETQCKHSNRRTWGSDGTDIRKATAEELIARSRLPKTISFTAHNPDGCVVFKSGRSDVLKIKHYLNGNSLLLTDAAGSEITVEIFDIVEATADEIHQGCRQDQQALSLSSY